jgi:hypothetical protein
VNSPPQGRCPKCGSINAYVGTKKVQCPNADCVDYDSVYLTMLEAMEQSEDSVEWLNIQNPPSEDTTED